MVTRNIELEQRLRRPVSQHPDHDWIDAEKAIFFQAADKCAYGQVLHQRTVPRLVSLQNRLSLLGLMDFIFQFPLILLRLLQFAGDFVGQKVRVLLGQSAGIDLEGRGRRTQGLSTALRMISGEAGFSSRSLTPQASHSLVACFSWYAAE